MMQPNYSFAKRQRELAKKQKREEKRLWKLGVQPPPPQPPATPPAAPATVPPAEPPAP